MRLLLVALVTLTACQVEEIGTGDGSITITNEEDAEISVLISDNDDCVVGLHSSVNTSTRRMFSVGETSHVCVGEAPPGIPVQDGKTYALRDGTLVELQP